MWMGVVNWMLSFVVISFCGVKSSTIGQDEKNNPRIRETSPADGVIRCVCVSPQTRFRLTYLTAISRCVGKLWDRFTVIRWEQGRAEKGC